MALVKPPETSGGGYLGFQNFVVTKVEDLFKKGEVDTTTPQICLQITLQAAGSDYDNNLRIWGDVKFAPDGSIDAGETAVLKKLYSFFEAIGFTGGINSRGQWESGEGEIIEDIGTALQAYLYNTIKTPEPKDCTVRAYVYKKWNASKRKAYTTIYPRFAAVGNKKSIADLESFIDFMIKKGFLDVSGEPAAAGSGEGYSGSDNWN